MTETDWKKCDSLANYTSAITLRKGNVLCVQNLLEGCSRHHFTHAQITKKPEIWLMGWLWVFVWLFSCTKT